MTDEVCGCGVCDTPDGGEPFGEHDDHDDLIPGCGPCERKYEGDPQ